MKQFFVPKKNQVYFEYQTFESISVRSSVGFKIGAVTCLFFFCQQGNTWYMYNAGTKFPIIQSMVAKRGLTNWTNVHTSMWKSRLKHSIADFQLIQQYWLQLNTHFLGEKNDN